jgi:hypothetical protein
MSNEHKCLICEVVRGETRKVETLSADGRIVRVFARKIACDCTREWLPGWCLTWLKKYYFFLLFLDLDLYLHCWFLDKWVGMAVRTILTNHHRPLFEISEWINCILHTRSPGSSEDGESSRSKPDVSGPRFPRTPMHLVPRKSCGGSTITALNAMLARSVEAVQ